MGFVAAARRAGSNEIPIANTNREIADSASTSGSSGLTAKRSILKSREASNVPKRPRAHPAIASFAPVMTIKPTILERREPRAIRIAISCVRSTAEKAMTP